MTEVIPAQALIKVTYTIQTAAMNIHLTKEELEVFEAIKYLPAVSIILPFEPVMSLKSELKHQLKIIQEKVELELIKNYPADKAVPVIVKLQNLIHNLNFNTRKKALAIFVSPVVEKVFYLDIPVSEKIIIDESFEIRDLVSCKKQVIQYLVFLLSAESSRMYLGNCSKFILIKSNLQENSDTPENDLPERTGNFSDPEKLKEIKLDKFLQHLDQDLSIILNAYPLPVFVLGAEKVLGHFKKITRHEKNLVQFVHGNYLDASETEIREVMKPYVSDWREMKERALLLQLEQAKGDKKLEYGIRQVWKAATQKNCHLLLVEKNFIYPAHQGPEPESISREDFSLNNPFYIKDAVDDVMEKVLEAGGDIEFVRDGILNQYGHIALIRFY
jgi:hypothetical protein